MPKTKHTALKSASTKVKSETVATSANDNNQPIRLLVKGSSGQGFCRLATRRLKRHIRVKFHRDAKPLDLLISIQDGAG